MRPRPEIPNPVWSMEPSGSFQEALPLPRQGRRGRLASSWGSQFLGRLEVFWPQKLCVFLLEPFFQTFFFWAIWFFVGNELLKPSVVGRNKLEVCLFLSGSNRSRKSETCEIFSAHFVEKRLIHLSKDFSVLSIRCIYICIYVWYVLNTHCITVYLWYIQKSCIEPFKIQSDSRMLFPEQIQPESRRRKSVKNHHFSCCVFEDNSFCFSKTTLKC